MKQAYWNLRTITNSKQFQYGTWDIEAANWWDLKLIGIFDGYEYRPFVSVPEFLSHIMQRKYENWHWFAHFGGRYDINFVFDFIRQYPKIYNIKFYCSGSMVLRLTIQHGRRITHLLDSFRLLPASLEKLTNSFNVEHKKGSIDFTKIELNKELLEYNESDCRGLYECINKLYKRINVQADTYASLSMAYWKKNHLKQDLIHPSEEIKEFIRKGYHGGRVEVFKHQSHNVSAYDVNSMYPYCMKSRIPTAFKGITRNIECSDEYYGFAHVLIDVPDMYIPPLPVRKNKLYFPVGTFSGIWSFEEIQYAISKGAKVLKIYKAYTFFTEYLFVEFVDKLYEWKVSGDETMRTIAKFLLNSLYGKFGQSPEKDVYIVEKDAPAGAELIFDVNGNPTEFAKYTKRSMASHLLPHISAAITSKARLELAKVLNEQSYYCDTDSVFTTNSMPIYTKKLGSWEPQGHGHGIFYQPKLYFFEGKWKAKGINSKEQDVIKFVQGEVNISTRTVSVKEALRKGVPACASVQISKHFREDQPKRKWNATHTDTRPWDITEIT